MYERFTDRSRKVMRLANQEAQRCNHEYIGTEHILLGLVKEGAGVAAHVLRNLGIDLRKIRLEVEKIVQSGPDMVTMGKLPQTPRAKKVIEYSIEEARNLNHNYVGTEHLLLGLLCEQEGVAARVLMNLGLKLERVREEVLNFLGHNVQRQSAPRSPIPGDAPTPGMLTAMQQLLLALNRIIKARLAERKTANTSEPSATPSNEQETRIRALERQLATVRFLLGTILGTGAGFVLGDRLGAAVGLLAGGAVALVGRVAPAVVVGAVAGAFVASAQFGNDVGIAAGAAVGALLASCVAEVGRPPKA